MLVQDTLTGAVHEIPQSQLYEADYAESPDQMAEGQILYDGLGNPVGFSFLKRRRKRLPRASKLAPFTSLLPIPGAGLLTQAAQRVLPGVISKLGDGYYGEAVPVQPVPAQPCNAAARMDSSPIALPGQEGAPHVFAMRLMARSKGFGARGCRTGTTCARSRCPTSPAGARSHAARSHGTAICSPPPALVHSPVSESSLCAGA